LPKAAQHPPAGACCGLEAEETSCCMRQSRVPSRCRAANRA
jgi:hypothetical protein